MEQASNIPLIIFKLSCSILLFASFHNEFFGKKDIALLPFFIVILTFGSVVFLVQGVLIDNYKWIHAGLLTITTATALSLSSILRKDK